MQIKPIIISSGHGLHVRGARALIDEVTEARRTAVRISQELRALGHPAKLFHENHARTQSENVNRIVEAHNRVERVLDVSVHFNAIDGNREAPIGTETLYRTNNLPMRNLASQISKSISESSGLILRRGDGTWARDNLGFLNRTNINKAVLLEICFVNSQTDVTLYRTNFTAICKSIAQTLYAWLQNEHLPPTTQSAPANQVTPQ